MTRSSNEGARRSERTFHRLSLCLGLAFAAIWALVIAWEFRTVWALDSGMASLFNGTLGRSATWDLLVLFLSLPPGDVLGGLAVAYFVIRLVRGTPRAGVARYVTVGLMIVLLSTAMDEMVDTFDEYVLRHGPAVEIAGFQNPGTSLGIPHTIPSITRFPSDRAANYTMVFFICLFRFGRRAWPLALLPLASGVFHVAAGKFWPTDVVGGMILGWTVASVLYAARLNELANHVERLVDARVVRPATRLVRRKIVGPPEAPARKGISSLDAVELTSERRGRRAVADFVRAHWPFESAEFAGLAHKGKVFSLDCDGSRVVLKKSRFEAERRAALAESLARVRELRERGILPAPAIVPSRDGSLLVHAEKSAWYLSEWVDGKPVDFSDMESLGLVLQRLAILHAGTAQPEDDDPLAAVAREVESQATGFDTRLARAEGLGRGPFDLFIPPNAEHRGVGTLVAEGARSRFIAEQALVYALRDRPASVRCIVHGDTHPMNFLSDGHGGIAVLDCDRLGVGFAYSDLVVPMAKLMRRTGWDADAFGRVLARYEAVRPLARWELVLLVAGVVFPRALRDVPRSGRLRDPSVARRSRLRLLRAEFESALESKARSDFISAIADRREVPLVAGHPDGRQPTPVPESDDHPARRIAPSLGGDEARL